MKVQWGSFIVNGRGKIGDQVASENRYGTLLRAKVNPLDPASSYKTLMRGYFTTCSQAWRSLTQAQRNAWNLNSNLFSFMDCFATVRHLSGFNLYMSCNMVRKVTGRALITTPPTPKKIDPISVVSLLADYSAQQIVITLSGFITSSQVLMFYASLGQSAGIGRYYGSYYFLFGLDSYVSTARFMNAQYIARLGAVPAAGKKIFVKLVVMDRDTGLTSLAQYGNCIVVP